MSSRVSMSLATRTRAEIRHRMARHPSIMYPVLRRRPSYDGKLVAGNTEVVIEGFPRSGNTFAVAAFEHAQQRPVRIARHTHAPAQVIEGINRGLPVMVMIREPGDAVLSQVIRHPGLSIKQTLRHYSDFYERLAPYRTAFVTVPFDVATTDFGPAIDSLNRKFGTTFRSFTHNTENEKAVFTRVDRMDRADVGRKAADSFATTARPVAMRNDQKDQLREELDSPPVRSARGRANDIYRQYVGDQT